MICLYSNSYNGLPVSQSPFWCLHVCVVVAESCLTLCDPMDCSSPGSSVHGILQARILEWVASPFSKRSSRPRDQTQVSCCRQIVYHLSHQGRPHSTLQYNTILQWPNFDSDPQFSDSEVARHYSLSLLLMFLAVKILQSHKFLLLLLHQSLAHLIFTKAMDEQPPWQFLITKPISFALTTGISRSIHSEKIKQNLETKKVPE